MRNIALLEWGPASLFYIQPRELIKVRSKWLDGGPALPPFLSTMEEAKAQHPDIIVRYALSAFEDLNSAIKNLRRCFGFPYSEYIGYLNTLTQSYRARREHEVLIDRLRRWAMFGNVDAVFWIDYTKANQPPGSFKMGPRESRPFSPAHMQICLDVDDLGHGDADDESEAAWSDQEDDQGQNASADFGNLAQDTNGDSGSLIREPGSLRPFPPRRIPRSQVNIKASHVLASQGNSLVLPQSSVSPAQGEEAAIEAPEGSLEVSKEMSNMQKDERSALASMLQEEILPGPGGIYARSMVPGPGYYGIPKGPADALQGGRSFGQKIPGHMDKILQYQAKLPGPGHYSEKAGMTSDKGKLGKFSKAAKMVPHDQTSRKLPFISQTASQSEAYGVDSSLSFHCVGPDVASTPRYQKSPEFSFSKTRRPF